MPDDQRLDLGLVTYLKAQSVGQPGQRTFNITARSERGQAIIWMEKEQLFQLTLALRQLMVNQEAPPSPAAFVPEYAHSGAEVSVEFKVGDMRLRYDALTDAFTIEATDPGAEDEDDNEEEAVAVQFSFLRPAAAGLAEEGGVVVASGRPQCPYCHGPIDPTGHVCPKSNGHHKAEISLE